MVIKRQRQTKVYIMIGCPGAGKSTWVKRNLGPSTKVVSRDIIRYKLGMTSGPEEKYLGTKEEEAKVTLEERRMIGELAGKRKSFVIDDTNLNSIHLKDLLAWLHYLDCYCIGVLVEASWKDIKGRRKGQIPEEALRSLWEKSKKVDLSDFDEIIRVSERQFSKRTDYSSLDPGTEYWARWRRQNDKNLRSDIKKIDRTTKILEAAAENSLASRPKREIRERKKDLREQGNNNKIKRLLG